jgi:GH35 family endo-1,4-beta-xylanase
MKKTTAFTPLLLVLGASTGAQTLPSGTRLGATGFLVGSVANVGNADQEGIVNWGSASKVQTVIEREMGLIQTTAYPAWETWSGTGMSNVAFDLTNANQSINWAKAQGKKVEVHLLAGSPTYFPSWLDAGTWTPAQLDTLLNHWITFAMTTNGNAAKVDYWNVVNEAFMWNGSYWDSSSTANKCPWQEMGWEADKSGLTGTAKVYSQHPAYIRRAFQLARQHTTAKLELRDYYIEFWDGSLKTRAFYQLVKHLLASGTPLDAVGFQCHWRTDLTYNWALLQQAVQQYRKLGLEVYVTETDYGDADPTAAATTAHRTAAWDTLQGKDYHDFVKAAVGGGANLICLWGVADNSNLYWRKGQSALLFDENYAAKYSYYQFRQGILDGLATTSVRETAARAGQVPRATVRGGKILVEGFADGWAEISDLKGAWVAVVDIEAGSASIPRLARGLYVLRPVRGGVSALVDVAR